MVEQINSKDFKDKISKGKVLVDMYADWCGPCRMLGPIIESIAESNTVYKFYKLNVDDNEDIAMEYGVMSIPTLLLFEDGKLVDTLVGLRSKDELENILSK